MSDPKHISVPLENLSKGSNSELSKDNISIHVENGSNVDKISLEKVKPVGQTGKIKWLLRQNKRYFIKVAYFVLLCLYLTYLGFSLSTSLNGSIALLVFTSMAVVIYGGSFAHRRYHTRVEIWIKNVSANRIWSRYPKLQLYIGRSMYVVVSGGILAFLIVDTMGDPQRLIPLGGLAGLVFVVWITSAHPLKVKIRPVFWGLTMQFIFGLLIIRWPPGYVAFRFLGDQVKTFLDYTDVGSVFVFTNPDMHPVAFKILPVVVFFSSVISILYYIGAMQAVIKAIAWVMHHTMQTTAVESLATAAHIFIGQVESSVILKPFLNRLTDSELHAVLTGGFATVAGTVIAAYVEFGAPAEHVLSAAIMSAPAAMAIAKLGLPETEESQTKNMSEVNLAGGNESNIVDAAATGAGNAVKLVAYVVVNLIAFLALIAFLDAVLSYLGGRVGHPEITFQWGCSYVFMPLAAAMGIPWVDARKIARLIGTKIFVNEFLAFAQLGPMIESGELQNRTGVISTYILCGFGSVAAVGINLGALSAVAPDMRSKLSVSMIRAMIAGNIACFMTACIAGLLYQEPVGAGMLFNSTANATSFNTTILLTTLNSTLSPLG